MNSPAELNCTFLYCPYHALRLVPQVEHDGTALPTCPKPGCGFIDYGNPLPCIAVLMENNGALLLGSRKYDPSKGAWDILGGFVDADESAEKAIEREMLEETGLHVTNIQYLTSCPDRYGNRNTPTLNLCFTASAANWPDDVQIDVDLDEYSWPYSLSSDVERLRLFSRNHLPSKLAFEHQSHLVKAWIARLDH